MLGPPWEGVLNRSLQSLPFGQGSSTLCAFQSTTRILTSVLLEERAKSRCVIWEIRTGSVESGLEFGLLSELHIYMARTQSEHSACLSGPQSKGQWWNSY